MSNYPVTSAGRTDPGLVRSHNEDAMLLNDAMGLWFVFDGMGGHEHGALASQTAASAFDPFEVAEDFSHAITLVADRLHQVNEVLADVAAKKSIERMGTTAAGLLIRDEEFAAFWVGDSRAYVLRRGGFFQLTTDHTHVQDLVDQGVLPPEEAIDHPMSHVLNRALGVEDEVQVDIVQDAVEPGDRFLLCSDGLTGPVSDDEIHEIIEASEIEKAAENLIARAHSKGAPDNVTAILVDVGPAQI